MMQPGDERTASFSELLAELMAKIEEKQQTMEGRADLAANAARYSNGIRIARAGAAREMQCEIGRPVRPANH